MSIINAEHTLVEAQHATTKPLEIPVEDKPSCPACDAGPERQATVARLPDGALEIVILVCAQCAKDHPIWF